MSQPLNYESPNVRRDDIAKERNHYIRRGGFCIGLALLGFGLASGFGPYESFMNGVAASVGGFALGWGWTQRE